jgi:hypothetical protein
VVSVDDGVELEGDRARTISGLEKKPQVSFDQGGGRRHDLLEAVVMSGVRDKRTPTPEVRTACSRCLSWREDLGVEKSGMVVDRSLFVRRKRILEPFGHPSAVSGLKGSLKEWGSCSSLLQMGRKKRTKMIEGEERGKLWWPAEGQLRSGVLSEGSPFPSNGRWASQDVREAWLGQDRSRADASLTWRSRWARAREEGAEFAFPGRHEHERGEVGDARVRSQEAKSKRTTFHV